ncbi:hypothetical protein [Streptomyces sp. NPDC088812]|uniref:hypothetical protein n=1 Tax=Streptomyces sp. NPDC088812 TaxID=3365905 RepID=UPI0037F4AB0C
MKVCSRCGKQIRPGEGYHEIIPDSLSGARPTEYLHKQYCRRSSRQEAPIRR